MTAEPRDCHGTSKTGQPCKARPLKGEGWCSVHHPEASRFTEFRADKGHPGTGGRPRIPRASELAIQAIMERVSEPIQVLFDACEATRANGKPDWATRRAAAVDLLSWAIGRPAQKTMLTGADGGAILLEPVIRDEERLRLVYAALDEAETLPALRSVNGDH